MSTPSPGRDAEFGVYGRNTSIWCDRCKRSHRIIGWMAPAGLTGKFTPTDVEPCDRVHIRVVNKFAYWVDELNGRINR